MATTDLVDTHGHTLAMAMAQERRLVLDDDDGTVLVVTGVAATDVLTTDDAHGLNVGDEVTFSALTGGAGLAINTRYFVISVPSATTFKVSATKNGASVNFTTDITAGQILATMVLAQSAAEVLAQIANAAG